MVLLVLGDCHQIIINTSSNLDSRRHILIFNDLSHGLRPLPPPLFLLHHKMHHGSRSSTFINNNNINIITMRG